MTRIYLVRHGRTALNAAGLLRGHLDPELDEVGLRQASVLGDLLGRHELRLIVSSPLKRAVETARGIAHRAGLEVEIDRRLIDRDYGSWAGETREAAIAQYGSLNAAPGVETEPEVFARAMEALTGAHRRAEGGSAVVVSHDAVNSLLLAALDPRLGDSSAIIQDTGCFNVLDFRDQHWSVLSVNNAPAGRESPVPRNEQIESASKPEPQPISEETDHE
jgi:broad specificity phosphatase PhoE